MSGEVPDRDVVTWSERVYTWLLLLYPAEFRDRFGRDMRELFTDQLQASRRRAGRAGVVRHWLRTLATLPGTSAVVHLELYRRRAGADAAPTTGTSRRNNMVEAVGTDLRYAIRNLRRSAGFMAVAVLVIALGTGGVTTIFSAMNAILLRPLPGTTEPGRLVNVERTLRDGGGSLSASYAYYEAIREGARTLDGAAAWSNVTLSIMAGDNAAAAAGNIVSGNYFDVLGVRPALGRFFLAEEDRTPLSHPVIVLSYEFWRSRFGADTSVIGRMVLVNAQPFTVVGVAPAAFRGVFTPLRTDAWVPLMMQPLVRPGRDLADPAAAWLRVFARLDRSAEQDAARAELGPLTAAFATGTTEAEQFSTFTGVKLTSMSGLPDDAHRAALGFLALLFGAAALVLMIASVNVAALLSARALGRRREMAVRAALGATRGRLVRQLLTETLMLFVLGAVGGIALAFVATNSLEAMPLPGDVSVVLELSPDLRVLAFALLVALATGLIFGLAPALQAARRDIAERLRDGAAASGTRRTLLSNSLVVGQLALSLVLLVAAGLFLRALERGRGVDPGFDTMNVATTSLNTVAWGYDEARGREFYRLLRERVEAMPGVSAVSAAGFLPLAFGSSGGDIEVDGRSVPVQSLNADRGYFDVLRLPIVRGRAFVPGDDEHAPRVAVINETLAQRHWPDGNAIGSTFIARGAVVRIVGIARDAKYASLTESTPSFVYFPMAQSWSGNQSLLVRTEGDPAALGPPIRHAVRDIDPSVPPPAVTTLERETSIVLLPQRIAAIVTAALGALGLVLAAVGLYGIMAYSASRRTREIGIRMALGAHHTDVMHMMVRHGLRLAGTGVIIGLLLAGAATRIMAGLLFGVSPLDALTFAGMSLLFMAVALVASWLPARRAAAVDPIAVLRAE